MSKIKRSLPEDFDITDPNEPDMPNELEIGLGHAMQNIDTSITFLEKNSDAIYRSEGDHLRAFASRLQDLGAITEQDSESIPF